MLVLSGHSKLAEAHLLSRLPLFRRLDVWPFALWCAVSVAVALSWEGLWGLVLAGAGVFALILTLLCEVWFVSWRVRVQYSKVCDPTRRRGGKGSAALWFLF